MPRCPDWTVCMTHVSLIQRDSARLSGAAETLFMLLRFLAAWAVEKVKAQTDQRHPVQPPCGGDESASHTSPSITKATVGAVSRCAHAGREQTRGRACYSAASSSRQSARSLGRSWHRRVSTCRLLCDERCDHVTTLCRLRAICRLTVPCRAQAFIETVTRLLSWQQSNSSEQLKSHNLSWRWLALD